MTVFTGYSSIWSGDPNRQIENPVLRSILVAVVALFAL